MSLVHNVPSGEEHTRQNLRAARSPFEGAVAPLALLAAGPHLPFLLPVLPRLFVRGNMQGFEFQVKGSMRRHRTFSSKRPHVCQTRERFSGTTR